ncbi:MAG: glutamine--tRNA ligase/YqeY domain fusion protein [Burkholderiaceae bacterium]
MTDRQSKPSSASSPAAPGSPAAVNFIRNQIDDDLRDGVNASRRWIGRPAPAAEQRRGGPDPAAIRTRFPPEPNGYLHVGHAKSIWLNFGLARDYAGACHMRFDDTNPVKEDQEYVDAILDAVTWLGYDWHRDGQTHLYYASDYFDVLYEIAEALVRNGHAYVDSQSAEQMRAHRGTLTEPGRDSPYRDRPADESLRLLREMRDGKHPEGSHVLRARIDMASPNINLRDPALYRIRFAEHHRSGDKWKIYPMYDFAHPLSDALEQITHSICTLEFEDHRPLYDWLIARATEAGFFDPPPPRQYEFARLNLTYIVTSKRKLQELVRNRLVDGWDDPRMPTIVGLRRRGYTPESLRLLCERTGVSKSDSWIDFGVLEGALRDDLDARAPRAAAVLDPVELVLTNYPEDRTETCRAPVHPQQPERGQREFLISRHLWIEREDFTETPPKGYFRLFPGNRVRLKHGYVIECTGCEKDADGKVVRVLASYLPDSRSGTPGADLYKVKGNIHWLSRIDAVPAEVRLYERLFTQPHPDAGGRDYTQALNPDSKRIARAFVEPGLAQSPAEHRVQFERHGYFVTDRRDSQPGKLVFNRSVTLRDTFKPGPRG